MANSYFQKIEHQISSAFPDKWWELYHFNDPQFHKLPERAQFVTDFSDFIQVTKTEIFDQLNLSILSGSYIAIEETIIHLDSIENIIESIVPYFPPSDDAQSLIEVHLKDNFSRILKTAIHLYKDLVTELSRKLKLTNREYIIKLNFDIQNNLEEFSTYPIDYDLRFFLCNRYVAYIDHFISLPSTHLNTLLTYLRRFDKLYSGKKYSQLLKQKLALLIGKVILRQVHGKKKKLLFLIDNLSESQIKIESIVDPVFHNEIRYIKTHYELLVDWEASIEDEVDSYKFKPYSSLSLKQIHRLIKYYKDVSPSLTMIEKLRQEVKDRWEVACMSDNLYDKYCLTVCLIFAINNEFSLLLDDNNTTIIEAESLYKIIQDLEKQTNIKNFFPQVRFLKFITGKLENSRNAKGLFNNRIESRDLINKCKEISDSYEQNIEWCKQSYNYVFLLPYNESKYPVNNTELKELFVASSFLLPLVKEQYMTEFNDYKQKLDAFSTQISVLENIETEMGKLEALRIEVDIQKEDNKAAQIKSLEVIGIFTALVTFVAASIPSFKFIENVYQALLFIFSLSSSLGLFVFMLLLITRGISTWQKKHYAFLIVLILLAFASWFLILSPFEKKMKSNSKKEFRSITKADSSTRSKGKLELTQYIR